MGAVKGHVERSRKAGRKGAVLPHAFKGQQFFPQTLFEGPDASAFRSLFLHGFFKGCGHTDNWPGYFCSRPFGPVPGPAFDEAFKLDALPCI